MWFGGSWDIPFLDTDIRLAWSKLGDGIPSGYSLVQKGTVGVLQGKITPIEAASELQTGLAQWFEPAQKCRLLKSDK